MSLLKGGFVVALILTTQINTSFASGAPEGEDTIRPFLNPDRDMNRYGYYPTDGIASNHPIYTAICPGATTSSASSATTRSSRHHSPLEAAVGMSSDRASTDEFNIFPSSMCQGSGGGEIAGNAITRPVITTSAHAGSESSSGHYLFTGTPTRVFSSSANSTVSYSLSEIVMAEENMPSVRSFFCWEMPNTNAINLLPRKERLERLTHAIALRSSSLSEDYFMFWDYKNGKVYRTAQLADVEIEDVAGTRDFEEEYTCVDLADVSLVLGQMSRTNANFIIKEQIANEQNCTMVWLKSSSQVHFLPPWVEKAKVKGGKLVSFSSTSSRK